MSLTPREIEALADAISERLAARLGSDAADQVGDVHDAAKWLGLSVPTIERQTRAGLIRSFKVGRSRRYRRGDLLSLRTGGGNE